MRRGPRFNKVLFGFRVISPEGAVLTEAWMNTETNEASVLRSRFNGMPEAVGRCSIDQLLEHIKKLRREKQAE